jgi:hypothetical protein
VEKGRHQRIPYHARICERCYLWNGTEAVEDVHHLLFDCFSSHEVRVKEAYKADLETAGKDVRAFMQTASSLSFVREIFDLIEPSPQQLFL